MTTNLYAQKKDTKKEIKQKKVPIDNERHGGFGSLTTRKETKTSSKSKRIKVNISKIITFSIDNDDDYSIFPALENPFQFCLMHQEYYQMKSTIDWIKYMGFQIENSIASISKQQPNSADAAVEQQYLCRFLQKQEQQ